MKDVNKVILVGRLGADPIQRRTKSGFPVAHFAVATSRRIYKENASASPSEHPDSPDTQNGSLDGTLNGTLGEPPTLESSAAPGSSTPHVEETQWHQIVAWGKQGEACAQYLKKGHSVYVEGMIRSRNWSTKEGSTRTSFEIHSENISFLGWPKGETPKEVQQTG